MAPANRHLVGASRESAQRNPDLPEEGSEITLRLRRLDELHVFGATAGEHLSRQNPGV
jgi:hypothetical protein